MVGYTMLDNLKVKDYFDTHHYESTYILSGDNPSEEKYPNPLAYHIDKEHKIIIVTTPIVANAANFAYNTLKDITLEGDAFTDYQLLMPIMGPGITEEHIILMHYDKGHHNKTIYDSKTSNIEKLMAGDGKRNLRYFLRGAFNALRPNYHTTVTAPSPSTSRGLSAGSSDAQMKFNYVSLGTQSLFDGVSCGYHTIANIEAALTLIKENKPVTKQNLLAKLVRPVAGVGEAFKVEAGFSSFMKKAWFDTFMPNKNDDIRENTRFRQYFMGYPQTGRRSKIIYFLTLGFIINPLINIIKLATEGVLNGASEVCAYLKNQLIASTPKSLVTRYLRSGTLLVTTGLQGLFKGLSYVIRPITSPIRSFKAARGRDVPTGYETPKTTGSNPYQNSALQPSNESTPLMMEKDNSSSEFGFTKVEDNTQPDKDASSVLRP